MFIRHGHDGPIERTRRAIEQAREAGLLGESVLGSDFAFDMEVSLVGESYVSGEETALMEAIEGKRAMPRFRPPFPAQYGVWGKPSNINNVKTLAYVPEIVRRGGEWFAGIGHGRSTGTAILCLSGEVVRPGMYEVPFGLTLGQVIRDIAGGVLGGRSVKVLQTGGPLGGVLGPASMDIVLDFESMAQAGAILGSGGIIVGSEDVCAVDLVRNLVAFCQFESCGKCFPCRLGMTHLVEVLGPHRRGPGAARRPAADGVDGPVDGPGVAVRPRPAWLQPRELGVPLLRRGLSRAHRRAAMPRGPLRDVLLQAHPHPAHGNRGMVCPTRLRSPLTG